MVSAGLEPDVVVYGTLVNGYCKIERIDDGFGLFTEMVSNSVRVLSPELSRTTSYC
jgi:pentatricopeptide repeat protein